MADEKDLELQEQDKLIKEFPVTEPAKVQQVEANDGADKIELEANKEGAEEGGEAGTQAPKGDTVKPDEQEKDPVGESEIPRQDEKEEVDGEAEDKKDTPDADSKNPTELDTEGENDLPPGTDKNETDIADKNVQDTPGVINDVDELKIKLAEVEFEAETEKQVHNFEKLVRQQQYEKEMFEQALYTRVLELYDKYGIPRDCDVQELAEVDPAKYQILQNILRDARLTHQDVIKEIEAPVIEANQEIIFRLAGAEVKNNYKDLTEDEKKETAATFVQIINKYGLEDIDTDLKNKVEMSVARAKMICAKNKNEEPPKSAEKKKEQTAVDVVIEQPKENNTGKKLDDFKKDIVSTPSNNTVTEVTPDTVNQIWLSKQGNERLEFFKKHQKMIMANLAKGGNSLGYTDRSRRW